MSAERTQFATIRSGECTARVAECFDVGARSAERPKAEASTGSRVTAVGLSETDRVEFWVVVTVYDDDGVEERYLVLRGGDDARYDQRERSRGHGPVRSGGIARGEANKEDCQ